MTKLTKAKPTRRVTRLAKPQRRLHRGLTERVVWHAIDDLKPFPGNPPPASGEPDRRFDEEHRQGRD
jgi:hypothetical protein